MATSLLMLLDDIASLLDDVSVMSKVAAKKTAGVLGDDLALNAQQVAGVHAERELPVVWAVAKGSMINKLILVPLALLISALLPWLINPLLMLGGAYLCFEGVEKIAHKLLHAKHAAPEQPQADQASAVADGKQSEKDKIKGAVRTDFILSAEIVVITIGSIGEASLLHRIMVLSLISIAMTVGVYGLVAGIVKLDDLGLWLHRKSSAAAQKLGRFLLWGMPWLMRGLSVAGTVAMFLVGGGILVHGISPLFHWLHEVELSWGGLLGSLAAMLVNMGTGILAGALVLGAVELAKKLKSKA